jgi:hypothetical protein
VTSVRDQIAQLIEQVRVQSPSGDHLNAVIDAVMAWPHVLIRERLVFREHQYEIKLGFAEHMQSEIKALELVKPLDLTAAPEFVDLLPLDATSGDAVLITRYKALDGEWLNMADKVRTRFHPEASQQFREDMQKLADAGLVHPYVRGIFHWIVSSESETIFLEGWHAIRRGSESERAEMMETVDAILASRTG